MNHAIQLKSQIATGIERKSISVKILDEVKGEITAVVNTANILDHVADVVLSGAIRDGSEPPISLYDHDVVLEGKPPAGIGTVRMVGDQAVFTGHYFMETTRGRDGFHTAKGLGAKGQWSIAFRNVVTAPMTAEWRAKGAKRLISSMELIEVSLVFEGANPQTGTIAAKSNARDSVASAPPKTNLTTAQLMRKQRDLDLLLVTVKQKFGWETEVDVEPDRRRFVEGIVAISCKVWGVTAPTVRFFEQSSHTRKGFFDPKKPGEIWIASRLRGEDLASCAIHEAAHSRRHDCAMKNEEPEVERDTEIMLALLRADVQTRAALLARALSAINNER